jgi:methylenetetrahydrofolate dehydrogenase (NADP+)/methenyltetrahydrofolate cyclohydrolase
MRRELAAQTADFVAAGGAPPTLAAVLVGDDPASQVYVRNKRRDCEEVGMQSRLHRLPDATTQTELLAVIDQLNNDAGVHGILVQLPLPPQIDSRAILAAVSPRKDVDAFHPENVGLLVQGHPRFTPCTPGGVQELLVRNNVKIAGQHVVIVGRSDIVGKPLAIPQPARPGRDATVTLAHSRTPHLAAVTRPADILVVAIGRPNFVTADMICPGATVVDVGINRTNRPGGDVAWLPAWPKSPPASPVPGGVGPSLA